jgi:hypothetical protein
LFRLIRLVVSRTLPVGVKVAVQVMPPSLLLTAQGAVGDAQVAVVETAHRFAEGDGHQRGFAGTQALSATTMVAVGRWLSMA